MAAAMPVAAQPGPGGPVPATSHQSTSKPPIQPHQPRTLCTHRAGRSWPGAGLGPRCARCTSAACGCWPRAWRIWAWSRGVARGPSRRAPFALSTPTRWATGWAWTHTTPPPCPTTRRCSRVRRAWGAGRGMPAGVEGGGACRGDFPNHTQLPPTGLPAHPLPRPAPPHRPGINLTVEPGLYIPDDERFGALAGIGVRIEDVVEITGAGGWQGVGGGRGILGGTSRSACLGAFVWGALPFGLWSAPLEQAACPRWAGQRKSSHDTPPTPPPHAAWSLQTGRSAASFPGPCPRMPTASRHSWQPPRAEPWDLDGLPAGGARCHAHSACERGNRSPPASVAARWPSAHCYSYARGKIQCLQQQQEVSREGVHVIQGSCGFRWQLLQGSAGPRAAGPSCAAGASRRVGRVLRPGTAPFRRGTAPRAAARTRRSQSLRRWTWPAARPTAPT